MKVGTLLGLSVAMMAQANHLGAETPDETGIMNPLVVSGQAMSVDDELPGPSTVDNLPSDLFEEMSITSVREALEGLPNVMVSEAESARVSSFTVRGGREISFHELTGGRTSVGYCIDDIPFADAYGRDLSMFSVDRFSFYKGPHGTAFGIPHSLGVIDVVTRPPGSETEGDLSFLVGSYETTQVLTNLSGPVSSNLFLGIDALWAADEGWFTSKETRESYGAHGMASGRARLRWVPNDRMEANLIVGIGHHDDDPVVYVPLGFNMDNPSVYASPDAYSRGSQIYEGLSFLWRLDGWQVKSITAHRDSDLDDYDPVLLKEVFDPGSTPRLRKQDMSHWTQEFRAESTEPESDLTWRTGLFLGMHDSSLDHDILGLGPWEGLNQIRYQQEDLAIYGELTRRLGEHLRWSAGIRLQTTDDTTTSSFDPTANAVSLGGGAVAMDGNDDFSGLLPMGALGWNWSEGHETYFRYSRGMQPGGIAVAAGGSTNYATEFSNHLEMGHNSSFLGKMIECQAAVFFIDYKDYQSFQFNPTGTTIFNASQAHALGAETKLSFHPDENLLIYFGAGVTRAHFDDFESTVGDFSGNEINNIPVGTANLGCSYHAEWGGFVSFDWRYAGSTWVDQGNSLEQSGYCVVDARLGYQHKGMEISIFIDNLFNSEYFSHTYLLQGLPAATVGMPRVLGIQTHFVF